MVGLNRHNRAENFLAVHFHFGLGSCQHCGLDDRTLSATTAEQASAGADRLLGIALTDQRTEVGRLIHRIAGFQFFDAVDKKIDELAVDGMFDQDALHGNAGLAGIAEAAGNAALGGVGEIGVAVDDRSGVAAEFKRNFLLARAAFNVPTYGRAAGEADQLDALVGDQQAGIVV